MHGLEPFIPANGSAGNSAPVGGKRHHKLKLVTRKKARKVLRKLGLKMRGGEDDKDKMVAAPASSTMGGKRRKTRKHD
jgi:hypothetical protein